MHILDSWAIYYVSLGLVVYDGALFAENIDFLPTVQYYHRGLLMIDPRQSVQEVSIVMKSDWTLHV